MKFILWFIALLKKILGIIQVSTPATHKEGVEFPIEFKDKSND